MIKTILIVDDDQDFLESVSYLLERNGYRVVKAENGRRGLALAEIERPDLILMDIMMDERTEGLFVVQELRRSPRLAHVPVFVLSALYSQIADFRVPPDRGWMAQDEFFPKPVDSRKLLQRIRERIGPSDRPAPAPREAVR